MPLTLFTATTGSARFAAARGVPPSAPRGAPRLAYARDRRRHRRRDRANRSRAFLAHCAPPLDIRELLALASRAPSGANMQPWRAYVVSAAREIRSSRASRRCSTRARRRPTATSSPSIRRARRSRRSATCATVGASWAPWTCTGCSASPRGDTDGILAALKRNYTFFDAPVGIIITVDKAGDRRRASATSAPSSRRFACSRANEVSQPACRRHGANSTSPSPTSSASTARARRSGAASPSATRTRRSRSTAR